MDTENIVRLFYSQNTEEWEKFIYGVGKTIFTNAEESLKMQLSPEVFEIDKKYHSFHDWFLVGIHITGQKRCVKEEVSVQVVLEDYGKIDESILYCCNNVYSINMHGMLYGEKYVDTMIPHHGDTSPIIQTLGIWLFPSKKVLTAFFSLIKGAICVLYAKVFELLRRIETLLSIEPESFSLG